MGHAWNGAEIIDTAFPGDGSGVSGIRILLGNSAQNTPIGASLRSECDERWIMFTHILLPTDGSPRSDSAIEKGIALAKLIRARVTGLCVVPREYPSYYNGEIPGGFKEEAAAECRAAARLHLAALAKLAAGERVPCEELVETSDQPYEAIIRTAAQKGCDLILMASHGKRGIQGLLLGSETQKVLTHSKIPVLVYR